MFLYIAPLGRLLITLSSLNRSAGGALVGSSSSLSSPLETLSSEDNRSPLSDSDTKGVMRSSLHGCEFDGILLSLWALKRQKNPDQVPQTHTHAERISLLTGLGPIATKVVNRVIHAQRKLPALRSRLTYRSLSATAVSSFTRAFLFNISSSTTVK